jgi:hypothetical protein
MACFAPSEFVVLPAASAFGAVAESIIEVDYLNEVRRTSFFPFSKKDFIDFSHGFGNTPMYIAFLKTNNPKLSVKQLALLSAGGDLKIPDIMTHDPPFRTEYYEIKPNSRSGLWAGFTKLGAINGVMKQVGLAYLPGTQYSPDKRVLLYTGTPFGAYLEVFFHYIRIAPGLIVYQICAEGELAKLGLRTLLAILALIIVILLRGRVPGPVPNPIPAVT